MFNAIDLYRLIQDEFKKKEYKIISNGLFGEQIIIKVEKNEQVYDIIIFEGVEDPIMNLMSGTGLEIEYPQKIIQDILVKNGIAINHSGIYFDNSDPEKAYFDAYLYFEIADKPYELGILTNQLEMDI
ncbi:MAG: hypothetical protein ACFFAO_00665 [Candidatus Hermodarchaeota archaeon]